MRTSQIKIINLFKLYATFSVAFLLSYCISGVTSPISNSSATSPSTISGSDTAPVSVSVSNSSLAYYISVSSSHGSAGTPVSLNYSQDGSTGGTLGNVVSSSDNVYLETNSPLTHQLLLSTTSPSTTTKSNNLTGDNTQESGGLPVANTYIAPVGNTTTSSLNSATALSSNTWGFAMSNTTTGIETNNFNTASEYESESQTTLNSNKYATVPTNNNQVLLLQDTTAESTTTIYYGVKADRNIPAGSYSNTVLYTALAEQPSEIRVMANGKLNPTIDMASPNQTLTVYTSISTTSSSIVGETATIKFYQTENNTLVEKGTCANPSINLDADNYLYVTCTTPVLSEGVYTVELTLTNLGRVLTAENVVTYSGDPLDGIETMQTFTAAACNRLPEADTAGNNIYTLKDSRDNKSYKIAHLADNNCWMVQNLALENVIISGADSNLPSDVSVLLPPAATTGYTNQESLQIWDEYTGYEGNYYNWCAAIASVTNCSATTEQTTSICPKYWRLPSNAGNLSYNYLFVQSGIDDISDLDTKISILESLPYSFSKNGYYINDQQWGPVHGYGGQGEFGYYISRTPYDASNAYGFGYRSTWVTADDARLKSIGFPVRCVFGG